MLQISDLVFDAWGRRFFDHASASLPEGAKVGLVGRNGAGKSTLFKLVLGQLQAGDGDIRLPKAARIGSVVEERMRTWASEKEMVGEVRGVGAMMGMELVRDRKSTGKVVLRTAPATQS